MSRRRLAVRVLTAAFVAGSAAIGFVPVASADSTTTLVPSSAAWYQPNPTCAQASGCVTTGALPVPPPVDIPLSPYPAGSMHVGYDAGQETARSYLAFPYSGVDGTVTAATLDVPLDLTAADGSTQPETSKVQACLVSAAITPTEGSIAQPPQVSCDQHALLSYVETPTPHLHADLAPLLTGLLTTSGIALLPDNTKVTQTDAWRVVFSSAGRADAAKTDPPVMKLAITPTDSSFTDEPVAVPSQAPVDTGTVTTPVIPDTNPVVPDTSTPGMDPVVQPPAQSQGQPVSQARTITVGYAYPAVWLLPLVFLVLVPMAARALTRDLSPPLAEV
jgi:hypothetical protein